MEMKLSEFREEFKFACREDILKRLPRETGNMLRDLGLFCSNQQRPLQILDDIVNQPEAEDGESADYNIYSGNVKKESSLLRNPAWWQYARDSKNCRDSYVGF